MAGTKPGAGVRGFGQQWIQQANLNEPISTVSTEEDIIKTHHKDIFSYRQGHEEADIWPETWLLRIGGYKQRRTGKSNLTEAAVNQCHARAQASKVWRAERRLAGMKHTVRGTEVGFLSCPATCRVAKSSYPASNTVYVFTYYVYCLPSVSR